MDDIQKMSGSHDVKHNISLAKDKARWKAMVEAGILFCSLKTTRGSGDDNGNMIYIYTFYPFILFTFFFFMRGLEQET